MSFIDELIVFEWGLYNNPSGSNSFFGGVWLCSWFMEILDGVVLVRMARAVPAARENFGVPRSSATRGVIFFGKNAVM